MTDKEQELTGSTLNFDIQAPARAWMQGFSPPQLTFERFLNPRPQYGEKSKEPSTGETVSPFEGVPFATWNNQSYDQSYKL